MFMMSLYIGIQRLHSLRCTVVAVFLWIRGAVCFNFASMNGVRQEREHRKSAHARLAKALLSLFFTPLSFLFSYHTTSPTNRTPSQATFTVLWEPVPLFSPSLSLTRIYHKLRFKVTRAGIASLAYPTMCSNYKANVTYSELPQRPF